MYFTFDHLVFNVYFTHVTFISNVYKTLPIVAHSDIHLLSGGRRRKAVWGGTKRNLTKSIFVSQNALDEI